jgi:hypothetical protein
MREVLQKSWLVWLWLGFRVAASLGAGLFSAWNPFTPIEQEIAAWPPAADFGAWLERIFLYPWLRWDAYWYTGILAEGYKADNGSTAFHPLYILLGKMLHAAGLSPFLSLFLVSSLSTLGFFWAFDKLNKLDATEGESAKAVVLFAAFPVSFILLAYYTESTFLFFATLALYAMRTRKWFLTSAAVFLASLTRQQGLFLAFPILWCIWEEGEKSIPQVWRPWKGWLALFAAPTGLLTWTTYRILILGEGKLNFDSPQAFIYSALLSPSAKEIIPDQTLTWPWEAFYQSTRQLLLFPDAQGILNLGAGIFFLVLLVAAWKHVPPAEKSYTLVNTLVSFSMLTGIVNSSVYLSLPRHLLLGTPIFLGLARSLKNKWLFAALAGFMFLIQAFMLMLFIRMSWIP